MKSAMPYLFHVRGNENEIYAAESELRDTQKHINQLSATKLRESNINNMHLWRRANKKLWKVIKRLC